MSGEYWAGWFDHWGEHHHTTPAAANAAEYEWMLRQRYSVSMYMFHGGTSFGFMNGANSNGTNYEPDTTSYDYDAPLNESGEPTPKFMAFRDVITRVTGKTPPPIPPPIPARTYTIAPRVETASLWQNLPAPVESDKLLIMEDLDQAYGYILYRTQLAATPAGELAIDGLHDYAQIYIDRKLIGTLDRRLGQSHLTLPAIVRSRDSRHPRRKHRPRELHRRHPHRAQRDHRLRHHRRPNSAPLADLLAPADQPRCASLHHKFL